MKQLPAPINNTRIGLHYFHDADHYQESDLQTWLPKLSAVKASWITLLAPKTRSIPEYFIRGLVDAGIEPILQFAFAADEAPDFADLQATLAAYSHWGVHYVSLFDRPNIKDNWSAQSWLKNGLVERFTQKFTLLATELVKIGITPIFPGLEPGGDYWDTAFLSKALEIIEGGENNKLLDSMVLGCYAWAADTPLDWGAGGQERWAGTRAYSTPDGQEDQLGFRIFDWYSTISQTALGKNLPILILAGGSAAGMGIYRNNNAEDVVDHAARNLQIAKLMAGEIAGSSSEETLEPIQKHILTCNFWLMADECDCDTHPAGWFQLDGTANPSAQALIDWSGSKTSKSSKPMLEEEIVKKSMPSALSTFSIQHYLLLPIYEWGVADWHLDVIRPYIKNHMPTVGFSIEEAARAKKVTIVGGERSFPGNILDQLKEFDCEIEQIDGDGTSIAIQLMNL